MLGADVANLSSPSDISGGLLGNFTPVGLVQGVSHLGAKGEDQGTAALQTFLPLLGITVSQGAPGGPAMGDIFRVQDRQKFAVDEAMPAVHRMIKAGDVQEARAKLMQLGVAPKLINYYVRVTLNPSARLTGKKLADFMREATPEERAMFDRDQQDAMSRREIAPTP